MILATLKLLPAVSRRQEFINIVDAHAPPLQVSGNHCDEI